MVIDGVANTALHQLQEVVAIVAAQLNETSYTLSADDLELLQDDTNTFSEHLPDNIGPAVSRQLCENYQLLLKIESPVDGSSKQNGLKAGSALSQKLASRSSHLRHQQQHEIPSALLCLTDTLAEVLAAHTSLLEATIQVLERTKHGSLARGTKAHAEHLATVATGMERKIAIMRLQSLERTYTPEVQVAVGNYSRHLQDTKVRLDERERTSLQQLKEYEEQGEGMKEIAKRFGGILKECENVKAEIKRLGGEV